MRYLKENRKNRQV